MTTLKQDYDILKNGIEKLAGSVSTNPCEFLNSDRDAKLEAQAFFESGGSSVSGLSKKACARLKEGLIAALENFISESLFVHTTSFQQLEKITLPVEVKRIRSRVYSYAYPFRVESLANTTGFYTMVELKIDPSSLPSDKFADFKSELETTDNTVTIFLDSMKFTADQIFLSVGDTADGVEILCTESLSKNWGSNTLPYPKITYNDMALKNSVVGVKQLFIDNGLWERNEAGWDVRDTANQRKYTFGRNQYATDVKAVTVEGVISPLNSGTYNCTHTTTIDSSFYAYPGSNRLEYTFNGSAEQWSALNIKQIVLSIPYIATKNVIENDSKIVIEAMLGLANQLGCVSECRNIINNSGVLTGIEKSFSSDNTKGVLACVGDQIFIKFTAESKHVPLACAHLVSELRQRLDANIQNTNAGISIQNYYTYGRLIKDLGCSDLKESDLTVPAEEKPADSGQTSAPDAVSEQQALSTSEAVTYATARPIQSDRFASSRDALTNEKSNSGDKTSANTYDGSYTRTGIVEKVDCPVSVRVYSEAATDSTSGTENGKIVSKQLRTKVGYIDCLLLQSVQAVDEEKYSVFQALNGDSLAFFFGNRPSTYQFSGIVYDTYNQQWYNDFKFYYDNYLRGSKAIENDTRIVVVYTDQIIEGYILNLTMTKSSSMNVAANISFSMLVTQRTVLANDYVDPAARGAYSAEDNTFEEESRRASEIISAQSKEIAANALTVANAVTGGVASINGLAGVQFSILPSNMAESVFCPNNSLNTTVKVNNIINSSEESSDSTGVAVPYQAIKDKLPYFASSIYSGDMSLFQGNTWVSTKVESYNELTREAQEKLKRVADTVSVPS